MFARALQLAGIAMLVTAAYAYAETPGHHDRGPAAQTMSPKGGTPQASSEPTLPGQDAFATIQEIVQILEANPKTDWSKVNIAGLRQHLIDMNEVTLHAVADEKALHNGVEITITGNGRTAEAIKRMVPAHAHELSTTGWNATTETLPNGVKLVVISDDRHKW